jgi:hypothetical protein
MHPYDSLKIEKGVFHSIETVGGDAIVLEIDNPPFLSDIARLEDKYGRAGEPYFPRK